MSENSESSSRIQQLEGAVQALHKERDQLRHHLAEQRVQIASSVSPTHSKPMDFASRLESELDIDAREHELRGHGSDTSSLGNEIELLKDQIEDLKDQRGVQKLKMEAHEQTCAILERRLGDYEAQEASNASIGMDETAFNDLQEQVAALQDANDGLREDLRRARQDAQDAQQSLAKARVQSEKQGLQSEKQGVQIQALTMSEQQYGQQLGLLQQQAAAARDELNSTKERLGESQLLLDRKSEQLRAYLQTSFGSTSVGGGDTSSEEEGESESASLFDFDTQNQAMDARYRDAAALIGELSGALASSQRPTDANRPPPPQPAVLPTPQVSATEVTLDRGLFDEIMNSLKGLNHEVAFGRERVEELARLHNNMTTRIDSLHVGQHTPTVPAPVQVVQAPPPAAPAWVPPPELSSALQQTVSALKAQSQQLQALTNAKAAAAAAGEETMNKRKRRVRNRAVPELLRVHGITIVESKASAHLRLGASLYHLVVTAKDVALLDRHSGDEVVSWKTRLVNRYGVMGGVVSLETDGSSLGVAGVFHFGIGSRAKEVYEAMKFADAQKTPELLGYGQHPHPHRHRHRGQHW